MLRFILLENMKQSQTLDVSHVSLPNIILPIICYKLEYQLSCSKTEINLTVNMKKFLHEYAVPYTIKDQKSDSEQTEQ